MVPAFALESPDVAPGAALPQWARSGIAGAGGNDRSPNCAGGARPPRPGVSLHVYDPDAPTSSGWWHWAVADLPASATSLPQNAGDPDAGLMPASAFTVPNELRLQRYMGAAPPAGHGPHRYFFTVTALDVDARDRRERDTGTSRLPDRRARDRAGAVLGDQPDPGRPDSQRIAPALGLSSLRRSTDDRRSSTPAPTALPRCRAGSGWSLPRPRR